MKLGRTIGTAILGLFFFLFIALDLVLFGLVPLNSAIVTILPAVGLVLGALLGFIVVRRRHRSPAPAVATPPPTSSPPTGAFPPPHA